jgi:hypothetical protein
MEASTAKSEACGFRPHVSQTLEQIPAKACPGLDLGLHDFADKDLLQHFDRGGLI